MMIRIPRRPKVESIELNGRYGDFYFGSEQGMRKFKWGCILLVVVIIHDLSTIFGPFFWRINRFCRGNKRYAKATKAGGNRYSDETPQTES